MMDRALSHCLLFIYIDEQLRILLLAVMIRILNNMYAGIEGKFQATASIITQTA